LLIELPRNAKTPVHFLLTERASPFEVFFGNLHSFPEAALRPQGPDTEHFLAVELIDERLIFAHGCRLLFAMR